MQSFIHYAAYSNTVRKIGRHYHDMHQILFVVNGSSKINIDNMSYELTKGSLVFISSMESHSISSLSNDYERYEVKISPEILSTGIQNPRLYSVLLNRPDGFNRVINLPLEKTKDLFDQIVTEHNENRAYKNDMLSLLLEMLFIDIYRRYPEMFSVSDSQRFEIVQNIQRQFELDLSKDYSLTQLADDYHINKYYLSHIFKDITGYPIMDYLKFLRIAKAKSLLCNTEFSIAEIVKTCGFSDSSNFSRTFKNITNLSPRDFRKKYSE